MRLLAALLDILNDNCATTTCLNQLCRSIMKTPFNNTIEKGKKPTLFIMDLLVLQFSHVGHLKTELHSLFPIQDTTPTLPPKTPHVIQTSFCVPGEEPSQHTSVNHLFSPHYCFPNRVLFYFSIPLTEI